MVKVKEHMTEHKRIKAKKRHDKYVKAKNIFRRNVKREINYGRSL